MAHDISKNNNYLKELIKAITYNRKFSICIYDTSGALENNPALSVPRENMFHLAEFCKVVKTSSKGLALCMKCKMFSLLKASKSETLYAGKCYLGIGEIVCPVYVDGKFLCVIYLGNFNLGGDSEGMNNIAARTEKYAKVAKLNKDVLLSMLNTIDNTGNAEEYTRIVQMLRQSIVYAYKSTQNTYEKKYMQLLLVRQIILWRALRLMFQNITLVI